MNLFFKKFSVSLAYCYTLELSKEVAGLHNSSAPYLFTVSYRVNLRSLLPKTHGSEVLLRQ